MSITILKAGIADSIRDMGRTGYRNSGIHPGGALDPVAAALANIIAGNDAHIPLLELFFPASLLRFNTDCVIALAGADFTALINKQVVKSCQPIFMQKGDVLEFKHFKKGRVVYLAVAGGIASQKWLNSYSTNIFLSKGGYKGRSLLKGDELFLGENSATLNTGTRWYLKEAVVNELYGMGPIRIIKGAEYALLGDEDQYTMTQKTFRVSNNSNRMGYLLEQQKIEALSNNEMISSGVQLGTLQLLPNGNVIVLMADHQTTGGYPKIAHIIKADRCRFAQLSAGEGVSFTFVSINEAEELFIKQQMLLQQLAGSIQLKYSYAKNRS